MKRTYRVYMVDNLTYADGKKERQERFVGCTYASSPQKAISNIKFRLGYKAQDLTSYWAGGGGRVTTFRAEIA
jgi:hypothetical protein